MQEWTSKQTVVETGATLPKNAARSATMGTLSENAMQPKTFSLLLSFCDCRGTLAPSLDASAAKHAAVKPLTTQEGRGRSQHLPPGGPNNLGRNSPALSAKAWLLMDYDSARCWLRPTPTNPAARFTHQNDDQLPRRAGVCDRANSKQDDLVSVSQNAWCRGTSAESCIPATNSQATVIDICVASSSSRQRRFRDRRARGRV